MGLLSRVVYQHASLPGVYRLVSAKWYFDEFYSVAVVRPSLVVAGWFRWFDTRVIDGILDGSATVTIKTAKGGGRFDNGIIDGLANLIARVVYAVGAWRHMPRVSLYVAPHIKTLADMRGARIGEREAGGITAPFFSYWLGKSGLNGETDVEWVSDPAFAYRRDREHVDADHRRLGRPRDG